MKKHCHFSGLLYPVHITRHNVEEVWNIVRRLGEGSRSNRLRILVTSNSYAQRHFFRFEGDFLLLELR